MPKNLLSPLLTGLLSSWCIGLLWGVNIVLFFLVAAQLLGPVKQGRLRLLLCIHVISISMSTTHAALALADLIEGFVVASDPTTYYLRTGRGLFLAQLTVYVILCEIGDAYLTWRVYVVWERNKFLAIPLLIVNMAATLVGFVAVAQINQAGQIDSRSNVTVVIGIVLSVATQSCGTCLIAWRTISTPKTVSEARAEVWNPWSVLWVIVDSGCLYTVTILLSLAFVFHSAGVTDFLFSILGQISAFVPLTITLRESWKSAHAPRVAAQSTFLVDDRTLQRPRSSIDSGGHGTPGDGMFIAIKTTTHKYADGRDSKIRGTELEEYPSLADA